MSHIPSSAMPHAKAHEDAPPAKPAAKPFPWMALAIGGAVAAGSIITATLVLRSFAKPAKRRGTRKAAAKATRTPRRAKIATE